MGPNVTHSTCIATDSHGMSHVLGACKGRIINVVDILCRCLGCGNVREDLFYALTDNMPSHLIR
eukprot:14683091-Ditylum_brightwellii.AAC.1